MQKSQVLVSYDSLAAEFARCCQEYSTLRMAVAWCGDPNQSLPYCYLENFNGKIEATVGIAFDHTHPDAIEWFEGIGADLRVFKDGAPLFHPKVYSFWNGKRYAIFIGSSNLTYGGFYANCEVNCLIEGTASASNGKDIAMLEKVFATWRTSSCSFKPTTRWLNAYRQRYKASSRRQRKHSIPTPPMAEEGTPTASWLRHANWDVYYKNVLKGLKQRNRDGQGYHDVLRAVADNVPVPWTIQYFKDIEKRRIIGGMEPYGWLGHVAASGQFRHLLANGSTRQWSRIVRAVNAVARLDPPIPWARLKSHLDSLVSLGPTMKVWGRVLCIVRPDLYCTVASDSVRRHLSEMLCLPQTRFNSVEGYIQLTKLIHSSPWFISKEPKQKAEAAIWNRRVAFLDAVIY